MAVKRADGIGHFTSSSDWSAKGHNVGGGNVTWSPTGGRGGRGGFTIGLNTIVHYVLPVAQVTTYHHFAFNAASRSGQPGLCEFRNASCTQIIIKGNEVGQLVVYRADSLFGQNSFTLTGAVTLGATAPGVYYAGVDHQMQVKCTISNTVGEVTILVDGAQVLSLTNQDTYNGTGNAETAQVGFTDSNGVASNTYSDVLVDDAKLWGDVAVFEIVSPIDGDELQWARSTGAGTWSSHINANPQTGDTKYLRSTANGERNCHFFPNIDAAGGTIICIKATMCHRKEDPAYGAVKIYSRSDDDIDHDTETQISTESYHFSERIFETDPKDGVSFASLASAAAEARVDATQFGLLNVS
jgi:hypothetical protein